MLELIGLIVVISILLVAWQLILAGGAIVLLLILGIAILNIWPQVGLWLVVIGIAWAVYHEAVAPPQAKPVVSNTTNNDDEDEDF